jgi:hypothetical protein
MDQTSTVCFMNDDDYTGAEARESPARTGCVVTSDELSRSCSTLSEGTYRKASMISGARYHLVATYSVKCVTFSSEGLP